MVLVSCPSPTRVSVSPLRICHIFDEFRQVERQGGEQTEGTGLGLAIAKKTGTCWEGHSRHRARSVWARRLRCESATTGADIQGQSMSNTFNRHGLWRNYTTTDGLASRRIEHLAEDDEGNLWIATWDKGLDRFDGREFHNYGVESGLLSEQVMALKKDDEGRLWVGTGAGVCVMDGSRFRPIGSAPDQPVQFLELDDLGRMWCAGTGMLGFWEEDTYHDLVPQYEREIGRIGRHLALAVLGNRPGQRWQHLAGPR
jgi:hypothetical protein